MRRVLALFCTLAAAAVLLPPAAFAQETGDPGTVVSAEPLAEELWSKLRPEAVAAHRVTYWSTGVEGQPAQVTGAVFVPAGEVPQGGWPVLSWAHGTVGLGDGCAPSTRVRSDRDAGYLKHWLSQGYAVVSTDYVGLGTAGVHPYLDGRTEAYGSIDMVRAGRVVEPALSDRWVVIGQSQGGQAALFTTDLAVDYAPELRFLGGVATGPPSNLEYVVSGANPLVPDLQQPSLTAFLSYILAGLRAAKPEFDVDSYLSELGKDVVADAEVLCYDAQVERVKGIGPGGLLSKPLTDPAFFAAISSIMAVPTSGYERPFFIAQGSFDTVVWPPLTGKLVAELHANQQPVTARFYPADHSGTMAASLPDTTPYIAALFANA